ncbi:hypothetical protein J2Z32_001353 [Paenibacillus turicensis]|uniref:Uncharacterized protein n=1 Tax=Paenibacillus turicensis TaxID=160487 RepID=A0ABS4FQ70_9BACL|nr:hypothetical protein [Paenibacillus turicensis]MBP1904729.1 hypothetical protein [Paenibacillus turicensis]
MADVSKRFAKGSIVDGVATIVYTVPEGKKAFVKAISICNYSSSAIRFTITFANVHLAFNHELKEYDSITIPFLDQILESGEALFISKVGTGNGHYYISGREVDIE